MGWNEIDNKYMKKSDRDFVSKDEDYEIDYLKEIVKKEFPDLTEDEIDKAIKSCCKIISAPRSRSKLMKCLRKKFED